MKHLGNTANLYGALPIGRDQASRRVRCDSTLSGLLRHRQPRSCRYMTRPNREFCSYGLLPFLEADPTARFDNSALGRLAQEIFGSSAGHGRDAYDSSEAGFNVYLNRVGLNLADVPAAIDRLLNEQSRLPLQTRRDQTQIDFQQFSTPPAEALVVVKAAAIRPGMSVLEPSAGTGNIAVLRGWPAQSGHKRNRSASAGVARTPRIRADGHDAERSRQSPTAGANLSCHRDESAVLCNRRSSQRTPNRVRSAAYRASRPPAQTWRSVGRHRRTRHGDGAARISRLVGRGRRAIPRAGQYRNRWQRVCPIRHDVRQSNHRH